MKYISGADERRVLTAHLHIGFCVLDVVGQLVVPDGLDDPGISFFIIKAKVAFVN